MVGARHARCFRAVRRASCSRVRRKVPWRPLFACAPCRSDPRDARSGEQRRVLLVVLTARARQRPALVARRSRRRSPSTPSSAPCASITPTARPACTPSTPTTCCSEGHSSRTPLGASASWCTRARSLGRPLSRECMGLPCSEPPWAPLVAGAQLLRGFGNTWEHSERHLSRTLSGGHGVGERPSLPSQLACPVPWESPRIGSSADFTFTRMRTLLSGRGPRADLESVHSLVDACRNYVFSFGGSVESKRKIGALRHHVPPIMPFLA